MPTKKIGLGEMWKSEDSGEVYIVTSFYKDLFSSYAWLRSVEPRNSECINWPPAKLGLVCMVRTEVQEASRLNAIEEIVVDLEEALVEVGRAVIWK